MHVSQLITRERKQIECKKHGLTTHSKRKRRNRSASFRCIKCKQEEKVERHNRYKDKLIAYFGGECSSCGFSNKHALCFHHLSPETKENCVLSNRSYTKMLEEAKKCILLCFNCHNILHANLREEMKNEGI